MDGFPTQLLYVDSKTQGGLGYPCLSDRIQENKFAMVHRCSVTGGDSRVAADGLQLRAARLQGRPIIAEMGTIIEPILEQYWARSLLEWGAKAGLRLKYGGPDPKGTSNELIADCLTLEPMVIETLVQLDVVTMGDLTTPGSGGNRNWITKKKLKEAGLVALTPILAGINHHLTNCASGWATAWYLRTR